jgi:hypothetical protein
MPGFTNLACRWSEPCFLQITFTETWRGTAMLGILDVFTPRTDQIEVGHVMEALCQELFPLWAGVHVDPGEFLAAQDALRTFMLDSLASFRSGPNPTLPVRDFQKVALATVLDRGPENVAFYYGLVRDTDGHHSLRLRAHTLRHAAGPRLWFEQRLSTRLPPERLVAAAAQVLAKLPKRFEPAVWLDQLGRYSYWVVEPTVPASPAATWSGHKPVSFVIGPPGLPWASVFERSEIRGTVRRDDLIVVTTQKKDGEPGRIFLKCAQGLGEVVESGLLQGQCLEYQEGRFLSGLAEFRPASKKYDAAAFRGTLTTWKLLVADLQPHFPDVEIVPDFVRPTGECEYKVFEAGKVVWSTPWAEPEFLRLVAGTGDCAVVYPWLRGSPAFNPVSIPVFPQPGAENSVTIRRRRVRFSERAGFASVLQRVAIDRAGGSIDVLLTTLERPCLARRCFRAAQLIGAFGHDWQSLDVLHLHLLASQAMKSVVLGAS